MELLETIRAQIRANLDARAEAQTTLDTLVAAAEARDDSSFTEDEQTKFGEARKTITDLDEARAPLAEREAELVSIAEARAAAEQAASQLPTKPATTVRVGSEPLTYREGGEHSFLQDAFAATKGGDFRAAERLSRHGDEMRVEYRDQHGVEARDIGTSAMAGLVIPQYLVDLHAPLARAGRPFADRVRHLPLPASGMTMNISRVTTGTAVAAQATENSTVQETNADDTVLAVPVNTIAGMQDVSRQLVDRGEMIDQVIVGDLVSAYHSELDRQIIAADGTSGTHLGVLSTSGIAAVTYTDASPTVAEAYPKIADGIQQINAGIFAPADLIVLAPRRWGWVTAALDSTNRPLVVPNSGVAYNPVGEGTGAAYGPVGTLQGLDTITDGNVPVNLGAGTNEDRVIITRSQENILWEEPGQPLRLKFEEVLGHQLSVRFVVYGYSAFTAGRRPLASAVISGTGLVTPTF